MTLISLQLKITAFLCERQLKQLVLVMHNILKLYLPAYNLTLIHSDSVNRLFQLENTQRASSPKFKMTLYLKSRLSNERKVTIKLRFAITQNALRDVMSSNLMSFIDKY